MKIAGGRRRRASSRFLVAVLTIAALPSASSAGTGDLALSASGANGSGVSDQPGVACTDGGEGASWHYGYSDTLAPGEFTSVAGDLALALDIHSEAGGDPPSYDGAWMAPGSNQALITNERGSLTLALTSGGECGSDTLAFDGTFVSGAGTWTAEGLGSYRQATGSGTFSLTAEVAEWSDNIFDLDLSGSVAVLDPSLEIEVSQARWEPPRGASDFRTALVTFEISNTGPGDAFSVALADDTTAPASVVSLGAFPIAVGAIPAGASATVEVRYQLDRGRCELIDRGCAFDVTLDLDLADALDLASSHSETERVRIPTN